MPVYGNRKNLTTHLTSTRVLTADLTLINDLVVRNTSILKQLDEKKKKDTAEERLKLMKLDITKNMEALTRSGAK